MEVALNKNVNRSVTGQPAAANKIAANPGVTNRRKKNDIVSSSNGLVQSPYISKFAGTGILGKSVLKERINPLNTGESKTGAPASASPVVLIPGGISEVSILLISKWLSTLLKGMDKLRKLRQNELTHDTAGTKLNQSEKSVVIPLSGCADKSCRLCRSGNSMVMIRTQLKIRTLRF